MLSDVSPLTSTKTGTTSTVYTALADRLRRSIRTGDFKPGDLLGSEHELARREEISRMTVRRASELLVQEGLLERRPGKGLYVCNGSPTMKSVQVVAGKLDWQSCLHMARGVQALAREQDVRVQLYDAHGDVQADLEMLRSLPDSDVDGAVILSLHGPEFNECIYQLKLAGFPFVLVDQRLQDIAVPSVTVDNYDGGMQAGRLLLEQGHRRVAFIGDLVASTVQERLAGLRDALADAGVAYDRGLTVDLQPATGRFGDWSEDVVAATRKVVQASDPATAIFFSCDGVAQHGYRALAELGLSIPRDISVVGFDDDPLAQWLQPGLTTIRQPFDQVGRAAMKLLADRIAKPDAPVKPVVMPVELVARGSVAPPPSR